MEDMYRRGYGRGPMYYPPQQVDPSIVSFGQVQLYDPDHYDRIGASITDSQARYDASQAAIAQHMSDVGSADIEQRHRNEYMAQMYERLEDLYSGIMKDYDGDVGRASARVIQNLSSDRGLMTQLVQDTAREREALKEYQQLKVAGKAPRIIDMEGNVREKSFEEYHNLGHFDSSGNFIRGQFTPLRGAADVATYVSNDITKALNEYLEQGGLHKYEGKGIDGMLEYITRKGYTQEQLSEYFSKDMGKGYTQLDQITDQLLKDVPGFIEEFEDMSAEKRHEAAKKYVEPIIRNQVHSQYQRGFLQDPNAESSGSKKILLPINPYDTVDKGGKSEKTSKIKRRYRKFRDNAKYIKSLGGLEDKREFISAQIAGMPKLSGMALFNEQGIWNFLTTGDKVQRESLVDLYLLFNPDISKNQVFINPDKELGERKISGAFTPTIARGLVDIYKTNPFEVIDRQIEEFDTYFSENFPYLRELIDEGTITQEEAINLAEESDISKSLTFDVGIIPKQKAAKEYIEDMVAYLPHNLPLETVTKNGEVKVSKKDTTKKYLTKEGISAWSLNPITGVIDYVTKKGETVRVDSKYMSTQVRNLALNMSSVVSEYYNLSSKQTSIPIQGKEYINEEGEIKQLEVIISSTYIPYSNPKEGIPGYFQKLLLMEYIDEDGNIQARPITIDDYVQYMYHQFEMAIGETVKQETKKAT